MSVRKSEKKLYQNASEDDIKSMFAILYDKIHLTTSTSNCFVSVGLIY